MEKESWSLGRTKFFFFSFAGTSLNFTCWYENLVNFKNGFWVIPRYLGILEWRSQ
jgi:hypothetical protein